MTLLSDNNGEKFEAVARRYCELLANEDSSTWSVHSFRLLVTELYLEAQALPDVRVNTSEDSETEDDPEYRDLSARLRSFLKDQDSYWLIFDPCEYQEPVCGSLSDDLADIWRDLSRGLRVLDNGVASRQNVLWDWKFSFVTHWGRHAVAAVPVLHRLIQGL